MHWIHELSIAHLNLKDVNADTLTEHLGQVFRLGTGGAEAIELELVELKQGPEVPGLESFSLLFLGPEVPLLSQGIYGLWREVLGRLELFLVPLGPDRAGRQRYEAIIQHLRL